MKVETKNISENSLKAKIEKKYEDGTAFKEFFNTNSLPASFAMISSQNDLILNDFLAQTTEDLKSLKPSYKYDVLTMDRDDAMFFAHSIKGENYSFSVNGQLLMQNQAFSAEEISKTYKSASVSKTLMDMIANSQQTNKPVRIDFGNDISAVLRVSQDGKIIAEFIPSDKVAEEYLKNNISYLQQAFEEQDIPYSELSYKSRQNKQNNSQNSRNNREEKDK